MRSSLPLYLIYLFLKRVVRITLGLFYPHTRVAGRRHLHLSGPTLVVSNHPNTMIDALQSAARVDEQVFFLANASLFATPFQRWFFETFYCIPIERPQDTNGRPIDNTASFERCDAHLHGGGNIFIAPEGGSLMERRLRPLKTGTARIAFSAESKRTYGLGLRILPIGLNYEHPERFGSRLLVNVGEPIAPADLRDEYERDPREAVRLLTEQLETRLRTLLIDTRDEEEDRLVRRLETLLRTSRPVDEETHFHRTRRLIEGLRAQEAVTPGEHGQFREAVEGYFRRLDAGGLTDAVVAEAQARGRVRRWPHRLACWLGAPVFAYGLINNAAGYFPPRWLAAWLQRRMDLYVGYVATAKMIAGLITFPLSYALQTALVSRLLPWPLPLAYFLSLIPLGYFAHWYPAFARQTKARGRWPSHPDAAGLLKQRREIWERVERLTGSVDGLTS